MRCGIFSLFLALPITVFSGCGGSSGGSGGSSGGSQSSYPSLAGNWTVLAASGVTNSNYEFGGYITNSNASVTATLRAIPLTSNCYPSAQSIPLTGTITTGGVLTLTSSPVAGQVISVTGNAASAGFWAGTYKIAGGCAGGDSGSIAGLLNPSLTGVYSGTFQTGAPTAVGVTATLTQTGPDADGELSVTGTMKFSGSPCFTSGTITASGVYGDYLQVAMTTDQNGTVQFTCYNTALQQPNSIEGVYQVTSGPCAGTSGSGSLSTAPST